MIERQELWCHGCERYVQFDLDVSLNGNHVLTCPNCGHEHCRVVKNGIVTDIRWDQRNRGDGTGTYYTVASGTVTTTTNSTWATTTSTTSTTSSSIFLYQSWMNTTSTT